MRRGTCPSGHRKQPVSAFSAALAVAKLGPPSESERKFREERAWQSTWIARELIDETR